MPKVDATEDGTRSNGRKSRRDHIVALAAELFAKKGIAATTVRDIGSAAQIGSGSLYHHFDSKESIIREIVRRYLNGLIASYEAVLETHATPREQLEGLILASFEALDNDPHACEIFQNEFKALHSIQDFDDLDTLTNRVQHLWMSTIDDGVAAGVLRNDVDPKLFYRFARDAIWFTVRWYQPGKGTTAASLSRTYATILIDGFGAGTTTRTDTSVDGAE